MSSQYLKDKAVRVARGTYRTTSLTIKTGEELAKTTSTHVTNMVVNYSPDIYDQHEDYSEGSSKYLIGNAIMVGKNGLRIRRSALNVAHDKRKQHLFSYYTTEKQKLDQDLKIYKNKKSSMSKSKQKKTEKQLKKQEHHVDAIERKVKKHGDKIRVDRAFSMKRSVKATMSNQSRRTMYRVGAEDDMGSKVASKTSLAVWGTVKYKRTVQEAFKKTLRTVKHFANNIISFLASAPVIIGTIICSFPVISVLIITITVVSFFGADLDFSGRVINFTENEIKLENAYQTALVPDEILAITQTLGWTTQDIEEYEILLSFAFDQKRGDKPSFEEMMDNVFRKYNPARNFSSGMVEEKADSGYKYYHNDEASIGNLGNESVKHVKMTNADWISAYPEFKKASINENRNMASDSYVSNCKNKCRELLEKNGYNFIGTFIQIDSEPNIFTAPVVKSENASMSSAVGYRSIVLNGITDNSFHLGTDIPASRNTPVYACMNGTVVYADGSITTEGSSAGLWGAGNSVIIRKEIFDAKGKPCYIYAMTAHLQPNTIKVNVGQKVNAGMQIAGVGTTGTSTGCHVHFQVWITDRKIDEIKTNDWVDVFPRQFTDAKTGRKYTVDKDSYTIYLDGLMFYDEEYRNSLLGR